jgi:hypothetical protein
VDYEHLQPHLEQHDDYLPTLYQEIDLHDQHCLASIIIRNSTNMRTR